MALAATRHASQTVANTRQFQRYMDPLVALVNEYAGDLDAPTQGCLVHGSLKPQTIWIDANGSVTTVVGWQRSLFGDIEQDWALHVLGPYLGDVFEGYGLQRVQDRLNDPTCLGRLKAYTALHILRGFAQTTSRPWSTNTSAKLEAMVVSAEAMQTPNFVAQRVGRAVQNSAPRAGLSLNLFRASTRWALSSLAFNPKPQQSSLLIGALGAIYLAVRHPDQSTELLQFAAKACESLPANGPPNGEFPSVNTQQLLSDLALMVLDDLEARDRIWGQAAASLWLISSAFDILNGEVEPHFAIATEEHIRGLIGSRAEMVEAMHTDGIHNPHQQDFFHGLLVLAALHWMKDVVPTRERDRVRAQTQRTERVFSSAIHKLKLPDQMLGTNATPFSNTLTLLTHTQKLKGAQWAISATIAAHQTLSESNQKLFPAEILFRLLNVDTSRSTRPQSKRGPGIV